MSDSLKAIYDRGTTKREPYWRRARDFASLTLPSLFPEIGHNEWSELQDPFQSVGASGLASMTSKLMVALFPPGLRFFKIEVDPSLEEGASREQLSEFNRQRDQREAKIIWAIEQPSFRVRMSEAIKNLLVSGTIVLQRNGGERWRVWRLPQFVAQVDGQDRLVELVLKEETSSRFLTAATRAIPEIALKVQEKQDQLELFHGWTLNETGQYDERQEIEGVEVPDTQRSVPAEFLPVHVARFEPISGESYGRTMIERVFGDLASLEGIQQAIVELGAEAARLIWGIRPNSVVRPSDLEGAPNGSYRVMNPDDVFAVRVEKLQDLQTVTAIAQEIRADIQGQMGMRMAVQRDAERVTALEVATMAQELDATLGGTYSALSEELQLPVLRIVESELVRSGELPAVPGGIRTRIIAGLEGLGRQIEFQQATRFLAAAAGLPPEAIAFDLDTRKVVEMLARATGLDPSRVLRTVTEADQARQAAQQAAQAQAVAPELVRQGGALLQQATSQR